MSNRFIRPLLVATLAGAGIAVACPPEEFPESGPDQGVQRDVVYDVRPAQHGNQLKFKVAPVSLRLAGTGADRESNSESTSKSVIADGDLKIEITSTTKVTTDKEGNESRNEANETKAWLAGQEIPQDRIRRSDNALEILDDSGNVIRSIELPGIQVFAGGAGGGAGARAGVAKVLAKARSGGHAGQGAFHVAGPGGVTFNSKGGGPTVMAMEAPKVMLGVTMDQPDETLAEQLHVSVGEVTVLTGVRDDTPAAKAGLQRHDVIVSVDGKSPASPQSIRDALKEKEPGQSVKLSVISGGRTKDVTVKLEPFDAGKMGGAVGFSGTGTFDVDDLLRFQTDDDHMKMMRQLHEHLKDMNVDGEFDFDTFFAPMQGPQGPGAMPGNPGPNVGPVGPAGPGAGRGPGQGGKGMYRFLRPHPVQGMPGGAGNNEERIRDLENQVEHLSEMIRMLEERLHGLSDGNGNPPPPPPPHAPRAPRSMVPPLPVPGGPKA